MGGFLVAGGVAFWVIVAIILFATYAGAANESFFFTTVGVIALCLLLYWSGAGATIKDYLPTKWWQWVLIAVAYVGSGAGWSVFHWYDFYKGKVQYFKEHKVEIFTNYKWDKLPLPEQEQKWQEYLDWQLPTAAASKSRIMVWIAYWPFDLVHWFLGDFLFQLFERVYNYLAEIYDRIAAHLRKDL